MVDLVNFVAMYLTTSENKIADTWMGGGCVNGPIVSPSLLAQELPNYPELSRPSDMV